MSSDGANRVLVVESGAKTKTITGFLGGEFDVVASGGHIVDLPDDELGVDVEDFSYSLVPIQRGNGDAVDSIKSTLAGADEVYLATDPDREGETIAADIRDHAVPPGATVHRIEFNAITYPTVMEALENPRAVNENRVEAQRARRSLDRLIGFILSSITKFDLEGPQAPSVGRVQTPAVRLVVDREAEIEAFEPRVFWTMSARIAAGEEEFEAAFDGEWERDEFEAVKDVIATIEDRGSLTVEDCEVDPTSEQNPLPPYTTDSLQNDADYLLNVSPERTMELAQKLYEGVDISPDGEDEDTRALITYMRTDSTRVSPSALNQAKETLGKREDLGEDRYKGRTWEPSGPAQDAHEAIRPTHPEDPDVWPENLEGHLDEPLLELYELIFKRFLASQMVPAVYRQTTLELSSGAYVATATGNELRDPGFLAVWRDVRPNHGRAEVEIPEADIGAELPVVRGYPEKEETQPPPRYREGSLVSELKDRGIGRPSTYGDILRKIKRSSGYGYVRKTGRTLRPTDKGERLVDYLEEEYPEVVDYEYTARMEADLDRIESDGLSYREYLETEFEWLAGPYRTATDKGWLDSDMPTPAQIEFLQRLADETGTEVPEHVFDSKERVSAWIDKLQEQVVPHLELTDVHEASVNGVDVHRVRLYYNRLPDDEREYLKDLGFRYQSNGDDAQPCYQFQRTDREEVVDCRQTVKERYESGRVDSGIELSFRD